MRQKAILWWQALSERERRILRIWALAVLALLVWFALLAPLNKRIAQLETRIPQLESRLNAMRAVPSSAPQAKTSANKDSADLRSTLFRLLSEKKISAELRALSSTRVEVRLPEMPMKNALDLLDELRQASATRVVVFNAKTESANADASRLVVELENAP